MVKLAMWRLKGDCTRNIDGKTSTNKDKRKQIKEADCCGINKVGKYRYREETEDKDEEDYEERKRDEMKTDKRSKRLYS